MDFFRFIFSKKFLKHVAWALGILVLLILGIFITLNLYTKHGQYLYVPDFTGKNITEVIGNAQYSDYGFIVIDSVFDLKVSKGMILRQDPFPESKVKKNRKIYLTIVSTNPEKTVMPDLKFLTMRQAISILESTGLKAGKISYIPTFDHDAVQQQFYERKVIEPGTKLDKGSVIDLMVGMGSQGQAPADVSRSDSSAADSM